MHSSLGPVLSALTLESGIQAFVETYDPNFVVTTLKYLLQQQASNIKIQPNDEVSHLCHAIAQHYGHWYESEVFTTRNVIIALINHVPIAKRIVLEHIVACDDAALAQYLKIAYYLYRYEHNKEQLPEHEYITWLQVLDQYRSRLSDSDGIYSRVATWLYQPSTFKALNRDSSTILNYIEGQLDFDLCSKLVTQGTLPYQNLMVQADTPDMIAHLLDPNYYRQHIVDNTDFWLARLDLSNKQKWEVIQSNNMRVTPTGNLRDYIARIVKNYKDYSSRFIEEAFKAVVALKYGETFEPSDWGVAQFIMHLNKRWTAEKQDDALVLLASYKPELFLQIKNIILEYDDVALLKVLAAHCATIAPLPGLGYWNFVTDLQGHGETKVTAEIYSSRMLQLLHGTPEEALIYLRNSQNVELCRYLIKHGILKYLDALQELRDVPSLRESMLEPPFFYLEMLANKAVLLNEYKDILNDTHLDFLNKVGNSEYRYSGADRTRYANYLHHHISKVLDLFTEVTPNSDMKLLQHLLYLKHYDPTELKSYLMLIGDADTAIIILAKKIGEYAWNLVRRYIIDYDDPDLLKTTFAFLGQYPELQENVGYLRFVEALKLNHKHKVGIYLSNVRDLKDIFDPNALRSYIIEHNDLELCDIAINRGIISYPSMWQVANQSVITLGTKLFVDHLLDYTHYRYHLSYYRPYLLEHAPISRAAKIAIKQPMFVHEAYECIAEFGTQRDAQERSLLLLEHNIYKLFAVAFEESDGSSLFGYIFQFHTPAAVAYGIGDALYKAFNMPISIFNRFVIQPLLQAGNFWADTITQWIVNLPQSLNPIEIWRDIINKKKHIEWSMDFKSFTPNSINLEILKVYTDKVNFTPQHMDDAIPYLRKLLGYLHLEQQTHLLHKKNIIFDTIRAIADYASQGKVSYELLQDNDAFGIGGGINEYILHPENYGLNVAHPLYRLLYLNPAPLIIDSIPYMQTAAQKLASWLYPAHQLPLIIIPNYVGWYEERSAEQINEDAVLAFYVKHAPLEVWHQLIRKVASSNAITSPALDVFRVIRYNTPQAAEILRDIAKLLIQYQHDIPSTSWNAAYLYRDVMSEVDWAAYQIINLADRGMHKMVCQLLFVDNTTVEGVIAFAEARTQLALNEDMAHNINRIQYDERHMVTLAYFVARCKIVEYLQVITPHVYKMVIANQEKLMSHTEIPALSHFTRELLSAYLAPLDHYVKPFALSNLPQEMGLMKVAQPTLDVVRNVLLHNDPLDDANHYIAAAASQIAPAEIMHWLLNAYAQKLYLVPLGRLGDEEKRATTHKLSNDMTVWVDGALLLMRQLAELQPTALDRLDEQKYQWWQNLRIDIGKKIATFFETAAQYFDPDQYARAMVAAMSANHKSLHYEIPVASIYMPLIREQAMISLGAGTPGTANFLQYMIYNDMMHARDYKFAAFRKGGPQFYEGMVRPIIKNVMDYIRGKILPQAIWNENSKEWVRTIVREEEMLYTLDMVNYFDGQDKAELWTGHVQANGLDDVHTTLYRTVQTYISKPAVLARALRDNELVRLFLRHVNETMVHPKYLKINSMMTALDIVHRSLDLMEAKNLYHAPIYDKALDMLIRDLFGSSQCTDFIRTGAVLGQMHNLLSAFGDPFYKEVPTDIVALKQYDKFDAVRTWVLSLPEIEQAEAMATIEFLALYDTAEG